MKAILSILIGGVLIASFVLFFVVSSSDSKTSQSVNNISMVEGKQIITIRAKGGYLPKITTAKAGFPTILKMDTQGTFDCSSALTIPSLSFKKNLPPSGETIIDILPQKAGAVIRGLCSMGMYSFTVYFN